MRHGVPPYSYNNINQYSETETTRRLIPYFRKAFSEQLIPIMKEELRDKTAQIQINSGLFSEHDGNITMSIVSALRRAKFRVIGCIVNDWCSLNGYQGVVNVWVQLPNNFPDEAEKSTRRRNKLNFNVNGEQPNVAYLRTSLAEHLRENANRAMKDLTGKHVVLGVGESRAYLPANKGGRQENAARRRNDESLTAWKIWNLTISKANSDVEISFRKTAEKIEEKLMDWIRNGSISIIENMASIIPHRDRLQLLDEYEKAKNQAGQGFRVLTTPAEMESRREFEEAFVRMRKEFRPWLTSKLAKKHWTDVYMEEKRESRKRRQLDLQSQSVNKKPSSTEPLDLSKSKEAPPYGSGTGSQPNTAPVQSTEEVLLNSYSEPWEDDGQSDLLRSIHEDIQVTKERLIENMEEGNSAVVDICSPEHEYNPEEPVGLFTSIEEISEDMGVGDSRHVHFEIPEEDNQMPVEETNLFTPENEENQCPFDASSEAVLSTSVDKQSDVNISHPDPTNFGSPKDLVLSKSSGPANLRNIPRDLVFPSPTSPVLSVKTQTENLGAIHGTQDGTRFYASGPMTPDQQLQEDDTILIGKPEMTDINSNTMPPCKEGNPERLMKCLRV